MANAETIRDRARAQVGKTVREKLRLDSLLGVGGTAAVYAATHRNGRRVAVKMLRPELASYPDIVARFVREGYVANQIAHPNVVSVLDDDIAEDGSPFLVMELLDGLSLERFVKGPRALLPLDRVLNIGEELLDVLIVAHERGVVHRDIKPANVFLTRQGVVKVLDFGIARIGEALESGMTQTGTAIGTPGYMPPEQARGRWNQVDGRTDLWAVGATLYALLTGTRPRKADTVQEELLLAMTAPIPPLTGSGVNLPHELCQIIDRAVSFEMDARYPDARSMQHALVSMRHALGIGPGAANLPFSPQQAIDSARELPGPAGGFGTGSYSGAGSYSADGQPVRAARRDEAGALVAPSYPSQRQMRAPQIGGERAGGSYPQGVPPTGLPTPNPMYAGQGFAGQGFAGQGFAGQEGFGAQAQSPQMPIGGIHAPGAPGGVPGPAGLVHGAPSAPGAPSGAPDEPGYSAGQPFTISTAHQVFPAGPAPQEKSHRVAIAIGVLTCVLGLLCAGLWVVTHPKVPSGVTAGPSVSTSADPLRPATSSSSDNGSAPVPPAASGESIVVPTIVMSGSTGEPRGIGAAVDAGGAPTTTASGAVIPTDIGTQKVPHPTSTATTLVRPSGSGTSGVGSSGGGKLGTAKTNADPKPTSNPMDLRY